MSAPEKWAMEAAREAAIHLDLFISDQHLQPIAAIVASHAPKVDDKKLAKWLVKKYGAHEIFNDRGYLGFCVSMHWDTEGTKSERYARLKQKLIPALTDAIAQFRKTEADDD